MSVFLGGLLLGLVVLLALVVWSIRRHRDPDLHIECDSGIDQLIPTLAGLTLGTAVAGNSAEVLENGGYFDVLIGPIPAARASGHFAAALGEDGGPRGPRGRRAPRRRGAARVPGRGRAGRGGPQTRGRERRAADARRRLP